MKYIQSFYQYPVTYSSIGKGIPCKDADGELRNIAEVTETELETLQNKEPMFRALVSQKKYRVLNKLPESYKPASTLVNEARAETEAIKAENEALKAKLAEMESTEKTENTDENIEDIKNKPFNTMTLKELQRYAGYIGLQYTTHTTKAELLELIMKS